MEEGGSSFIIQILPLAVVVLLIYFGIRRSTKQRKLQEEWAKSIEARLSKLEKWFYIFFNLYKSLSRLINSVGFSETKLHWPLYSPNMT